MPIGILVGLAVCTLIYVIVGLVATGLVPFTELRAADPLARALGEQPRQHEPLRPALGPFEVEPGERGRMRPQGRDRAAGQRAACYNDRPSQHRNHPR